MPILSYYQPSFLFRVPFPNFEVESDKLVQPIKLQLLMNIECILVLVLVSLDDS